MMLKKYLRQYVIKPLSFTYAGQVILGLWVCSRILSATPETFRRQSAPSKILVLSVERFPKGELEALRDTGKFEFFTLPREVVDRLINLRWDHVVSLKRTLDVDADVENASMVRQNKTDLETLYRSVLEVIFNRLGISAVIGAAPHYPQDHDLGRVAKDLCVPYLVIYKECLITNQRHYERIVSLYSLIERNSISHIFVHNESAKRAIIESGLVTESNVSAPGSVRMDGYVKHLQEHKKHRGLEVKQRKKRAILFSFLQGVGLYGWTLMKPKKGGPGYFDLFDNVHQTFARIALRHPETEFIVKTKWGENWFDEIDRALQAIGLKRDRIPNLILTSEVPAQELILSSDVVVAFGSTTILEAGLAAKPVVIPDFDEAVQEAYREYIQLRVAYDAFELAKDKEELETKILRYLNEEYFPDRKTLEKREEYFRRFVSNPEGGSVERYTEIMARLLV